MKIFGICLIKNEADIIAFSLTEASKWADKVFVYDNGSNDGTWEIVQELAKSNPVIVPFKSEAKPFRDGLRAEVFNEYRHLANEGDWWCVRLDSDEFYIDNPKEFLPKVNRFHHVVTSLHYEYMLSDVDLQEIEFTGSIDKILRKINYYHPKVTSETRFIRHRKRLVWNTDSGFPRHKGIISPKKIRLKHYQYRSPDQIQTRIENRKIARKEGYKYFGKDDVQDWKDIILNKDELIKESSEMRIGFLKDPNVLPWHKYILRFILHLFKIFP